MRVALITESFLPHVNGVTNSVLRVLAHLRARGHEALVFAPAVKGMPTHVEGFEVVGLPSVPLPGYPAVRFTLTADFRLMPQLAAFAPDVVHLASPVILGWEGALAAKGLGIPSVALYQTEVATYAGRYGFPQLEQLIWWRLRNLHGIASRTLVPSTFSADQLAAQGIGRIARWGRGVDLERFHPSRRSVEWRRRIAPDGERIVGYVGRLAPEKQVDALGALAGMPGTRLVVVGDGPSRDELEALLPEAVFLGHLGGTELAEALASFDVFVHTGEFETFCQTIQEAHASGVPVVAPRRGGPIDLVDVGGNGFLYAPGDRAQLRARVEVLLADADLRARMGARARADVAGRSWDAVCDQLLDHYRAVIAEHAVRAA